MPAVGDQHKTTGTTSANPFEETRPRLSEYTAQEIATLQSRLDKQLGPEYISSRPGGAGQKVHYLAAEKVINLANEVFGFNGWSSAIQNIQIDFVDENGQNGKISLGLSVIVRVTLKDGTFHEDIGYGHIENCKGKAAAFEKAKKEGTTDALKRALRTFGNVLGNCIYDKEFVGKVTKIKVAPSKWDADNLHRHPDYAPVKKGLPPEDDSMKHNGGSSHTSNTDYEDEFGVADFDDADFSENHMGHPDEVVLAVEPPADRPRGPGGPPPRYNQPQPNAIPIRRDGLTTPSKPPQSRPSLPLNGISRSYNPLPTNNPDHQPQRMQPPQTANQQLQQNRTTTHLANAIIPEQHRSSDNHSSSPGLPAEHSAAQAPQPLPQNGGQHIPPVGFYSARAATVLNPENNGKPPAIAPNIPQFNPHAESPSIPKTAGIDHTKSVPIKRGLAGFDASAPAISRGGPPAAAVGPPRDFVNPGADMHRRIGAPGGVQSPAPKGGMSVSAYRPLTRKITEPRMATNTAGAGQGVGPGKRPPLNDVSNMQNPVTVNSASEGPDAKRQKMGPPEGGGPGRNLPGLR